MTDSHLAVVILAAGAGTRMKSATPKLLHDLAGIPIIAHVLATARNLDAEHSLVVLRHERARLAEVVELELPNGVIVDQDEVPGTGRALELAVQALPDAFDGDVLVLNGDVPLLNADTLVKLVDAHRTHGTGATILSSRPANPTGYGRVIRDENGNLDAIIEHRDASAEQLRVAEINAGVYVFGAAALRDHLASLTTDNVQGERYLTDMIGVLRRAGVPVEAIPVHDSWIVEGINDRAQLSEAAARLNAIIVRGWQLAGVTVQDPATTWIDIRVGLAPDVTILPGTQLKGATEVATGATIGPDTTLVDCEVGERARVTRTDATLAVIGDDAKVGPFAYLRAGTVLGAAGTIGTFVETKNARVGARSKLAHFNYFGDAELGTDSNFGAGAITANYDGVNKHRTDIGSHVRVATHTVFVAPVSMGDGAYTGAGTVVRKNVPPGSLAITVAPQRNIEGWVAEKRPDSDAAKAAQAANEAQAANGVQAANEAQAANGAQAAQAGRSDQAAQASAESEK